MLSRWIEERANKEEKDHSMLQHVLSVPRHNKGGAVFKDYGHAEHDGQDFYLFLESRF